MRALVVEDDSRLRPSVVRALARAGLAADEAESMEAASELMDLHQYDLIVIDRRLPDGDGLELCRAAREGGFSNSILILTAIDDPRSTVEGLALGADDYLGKPFDIGVLEARVKALLRRNQKRPTTEISAGNIRLNPWARSVRCNGAELRLTAREFRLLEALLRAADAVVSREDLLEDAWGEREEPMSNTIDVLMGRLRRKLDAAGADARIETVRGMGYRLRVP